MITFRDEDTGFPKVFQLVLQEGWGSGANFSDFQAFGFTQYLPHCLQRTPRLPRNREEAGVPESWAQSTLLLPSKVGEEVEMGHSFSRTPHYLAA